MVVLLREDKFQNFVLRNIERKKTVPQNITVLLKSFHLKGLKR